MKSVRAIARALVELTDGQPSSELAGYSDAAIVLVKKQSPSALTRFTRLVLRELKNRRKTKDALLTTPSGSIGEDHGKFLSALEQVLKTPVSLTEEKELALLGGAVLRIGDERFDASLQSALTRLQDNLLSPLPTH